MRRDARTEGLRWLEQAEADREGARLLFEGGSYHLACFVAQQVAEKAITAFLYAQGEEFVIGSRKIKQAPTSLSGRSGGIPRFARVR